jgi:Xaa-Pro aminopeptidase
MDKGISFCPLAIIDEFWQKRQFSSIILYFCEVFKNIAMTKRCAVQEISELLESLPEGGIMKEITDPVEWQRQQRDEWEIDLEQF